MGIKFQSCGINESGNLKFTMMTIDNNTVLNTRNLDLRCFYHIQREMGLCEGMDMFISLTVVFISLCLRISNIIRYTLKTHNFH